ncbi:MAG: tyrosine-protein phosphatase, partial [Lachnospiraceae bacterium]
LLYARCDNLIEVIELFMKLEGKLQETVRIELEGLCNTRDLGGYRSIDGRLIKRHRLIRSGALADSTETDRKVLVSEYCLKTIVDFRTSAERNLKPDPDLPGVAYIANPILEEETLGITREEEETEDSNAVVNKVISAIKENGGTPLGYMKNMYKNLIANPFSRAQYRKFFNILLSQKEGAVLWHCSAGKDRVGVGTILLLSALSIPREQIIADYMKVNEFGRKDVDILMSTLTGHMDFSSEEGRRQAEAIRLLFTVDRAYAESVFDEMEQEHGSVDAFLEREMGLTPEKREQLKSMYLE